ncbi:COG1361 S-layer family protein [Fusibacter bizertensis]
MKSNIKKIMIMTMVLMLIISSFNITVADSSKPVLGVVADGTLQVVKAGTPSEFKVNIKNAGYMVAQNVRVTIQGDHPFRSDIANLSQRISTINPNDAKELIFKVTTSPTAESKTYEFTVLIEYSSYDDMSYTTTEKVYVQVDNGNVEPILGVYSYDTGQSALEANTPDSLVLNIKNSGGVLAKDVTVVASGFSNEGVVLYKDVDTKNFAELGTKSTQMVYFNIMAGKDAKAGTFPITINISYIDEAGKKYTKSSIAYVTMAGKGAVDANLEISDVVFPKSVKASQDFEVTFKVTNKGNVDIATADVSYEYPENFISKATSRVVVKDLAPGASKMITFKLMAKAETVTENYHSYIKVAYVPKDAATAEPETIQEYVGLYVEGGADDASSKPKLIVDNYSYGDEYVYAGQDFQLTLNIKNTSSSEGTKNIKVTLTSEDNVFTPVDSSSSFFIPSVGPGQVYTHTISLKTKIDANVKIYTLTAKMEYEDGKGNAYDANKTPYSESEVLSIAVAQPVRLETAELIVPMEIYQGQPFYVEQSFYNMGKSIMYNMIVKLEGVETNEGSYFVGNFDAGKSEYFSAQVFANEVGTFDGKLIYTFEDALGNVSTHEEPFTYTVSEMATYEENNGGQMPNPEMPVEESKGMPIWQIIVAAVVVLAIIAFIIRKVLKARKLKKEMEDLDE